MVVILSIYSVPTKYHRNMRTCVFVTDTRAERKGGGAGGGGGVGGVIFDLL